MACVAEEAIKKWQVGPDGHPAIVLERQFAGDSLFIPPGWLHMVCNRQPCAKFAWDW